MEYLVERYPETANIWGGLLLSLTTQLILMGLTWLTYSPCFAILLLLKGMLLATAIQMVGES